MKTSYIITSIIGVAVVGGGVWYATSNTAPTTENTVSTEESVMETKTEVKTEAKTEMKELVVNGKFVGSLFDLSNSGRSYKCTVTTSTENVTTNGTVYVSGKNIRGDFENMVPVIGSMPLSMIANADDIYVWSPTTKQGMKSKRSETIKDEKALSSGQGFNLNQSHSYDCVKASAPASLFVIPADVTFVVTQQ